MNLIRNFTLEEKHPFKCVVIDEETGNISITVLASGIVEIIIKADGDIQFNGLSIIDKNVTEISSMRN